MSEESSHKGFFASVEKAKKVCIPEIVNVEISSNSSHAHCNPIGSSIHKSDGMKHDNGKIKFSLVDFESLTSIIEMFSDTAVFEARNVENAVSSAYVCIELYLDIMKKYQNELSLCNTIESVAATQKILCEILVGSGIALHTGNVSRTHEVSAADILGLARVYTYGANLYSEGSWIKVDPVRYLDALGRHLYCNANGEEFDSESGIEHKYHILWNCVAINRLMVI